MQSARSRSVWPLRRTVCGRYAGRALRAMLVLMLLFAPALAALAANELSAAEEFVIPAGQDDLLAEMLGRGGALPGQCTLATGEVDRTIIKATYACPGGEVVFELRHPGKAPATATQT